MNDITLDFDIDAPLYSISVVAEMLEISVHSLRAYEAAGLIIPHKKDTKHRLYSHNDVLRLKCIRDSIVNKKFSIAAIKTLYSMIPCWSVKNCSVEERNGCEAYEGYLNPCWTYKHKNNICELQKCNTCEVYKNHTHCETIKQTIRTYTR